MEAWVSAIIAVVVLGLLYYFLRPKADPTKTMILEGSRSGKTEYTSDASLFRSFNQPEGAVFSYSGWISVDDFTYNYGKRRVIFTRGNCPGLYLDSTSNSLLLTIATYGSMESILVSNIAAKKWIHVAIIVNQYSVDIYINGTLSQHHTLTQLPKQTSDSVVIGSNQDGWDGLIADLAYYSRSLKVGEIENLAKKQPSISAVAPSMPPYYDLSWYTGRFNST